MHHFSSLKQMKEKNKKKSLGKLVQKLGLDLRPQNLAIKREFWASFSVLKSPHFLLYNVPVKCEYILNVIVHILVGEYDNTIKAVDFLA